MCERPVLASRLRPVAVLFVLIHRLRIARLARIARGGGRIAKTNWPTPSTRSRNAPPTVEYQTLYPRAVAEGPIATAPSGGEYFSYLWAAVHKLSDQIAKLEKALMLTPEAIGDRTAPKEDRAPSWNAADEFLKPH